MRPALGARESVRRLAFDWSRMTLVTQAVQFHWSEFYQQHFKKIGSFYTVAAKPTASPGHPDHRLLWLPREEALRTLSQEFQAWALGNLP